LATVKIQFNALELRIGKENLQHYKFYRGAHDTLDEACKQVRRVAHSLDQDILMSFGLLSALRELCEIVETAGYLKCNVVTSGMEERLDVKTEVAVYRVIQEMMNNIIRHASAKKCIDKISTDLSNLCKSRLQMMGLGLIPIRKIQGRVWG
jgi:signal transduction histidine kinase